MAFLDLHTRFRPHDPFTPIQTFGHDMFDVLRPAWDTNSYETREWIESTMQGAGYVDDDKDMYGGGHPAMAVHPVKRQRPSSHAYPAANLLRQYKRQKKRRQRGSGVSLAGQMSFR